MVVEPAPQIDLHRGRGAVRRHVAGIFQHPAQHHHCGGDREGQHQLFDRLAGEDLGEQPAEEREARHTGRRRQQAEQYRRRDARAHAFGKNPEPAVEIHVSSI